MVQNITVRVPWTDNGFVGKVCMKPCSNTACLRLANIAEKKDDDREKEFAGKNFCDVEFELPCLSEGGAFMCPSELKRITNHPYCKSSKETHGHFAPTEEVFPPYSLSCRPFIWLMKNPKRLKEFQKRCQKYGINYREEIEPNLSFQTRWVQAKENQNAIFDKFFESVEPKKALCFIYAKQVPFVDDPRRVIVGIGRVDKVTKPVEYSYSEEKDVRAMTWETMVSHTIRDDEKDGFLIPYSKIIEFAQNNSDFDIYKATVFASDDYREQYSYATEHLTHDGSIDTLQSAIASFEYMQEQGLPGNWQSKINWCKERLAEVWEDRGGYPGLGEMLYTSGFVRGLFIAEEIKVFAKKENLSLLTSIEKALCLEKTYLSKENVDSISEENISTWNALDENRKALFELMCHFSLTEDLARVAFFPEERLKRKVNLTDEQILDNPYSLFEETTQCKENFRFFVRNVDMAVFPVEKIQKEYPIAKRCALKNGNDKRRIRALIVDFLERQSKNGHSIYPIWMTINAITELPIEPACPITWDVVNGCLDFVKEKLHIVEVEKKNNPDDNQNAFQVIRLFEIDTLITDKINKRIESKKPNIVNVDWKQLIDDTFKSDKEDDKLEKKAREEKAAVLKVLAESRLSVLIGGAGTGKTTLLSVLCKADEVKRDGILLLAPTGKARVKMAQAMKSQGINCDAKTVAQFLLKTGNFNSYTMNYQLSQNTVKEVPKTVIIDESSMLTEEMFGALLQALTNASRIIFVGDPNQLPPIGTGRPFVDLVNKLSVTAPKTKFPRVGKSFGELTVTRRQTSEDTKGRLDLLLSKWYTNTDEELDDDVFASLGENKDEHIVFKKWETEEDLEDILLETLAKELDMTSPDDIENFNISLGATKPIKGFQYFNIGCAKNAENWQILAPVKGMPHGVVNLNHLIHQKYRDSELELASKPYNRKIPEKQGPEGIVYGDKVINISNEKRSGYCKNVGQFDGYIANGEIGIAMANWGNSKFLNVEYSSQPDVTYGYTERDFGEETEAILELAYALTVHKSQGSEFKKIILILNEPCALLSKELLYTAITRQVDKLIILYNKDAIMLREYANQGYSDIARRFSCLFHTPSIVKVNEKYYEDHLIHRTENGELVRSKSEVLIADKLKERGIPYFYEKELWLDGVRKIPDFTIEDNESGETLYWEHCGMMNDPDYVERWNRKKQWYAEHGIIEGENLIVSEERGSWDSAKIVELINKYFG